MINHSSQYGIRGQVWIDHLPIKYYVPQGSQQGRIDNGPYQGNLGNYRSPFREDNDNSLGARLVPGASERRSGRNAALTDPRTGATVPAPGYNPNRFFGVDAGTLNPHLVPSGRVYRRRRLGEPGGADQDIAGDCIDLNTEVRSSGII